MGFKWANRQIIKFCNLAKSIVLTGSHATDEAKSTSDVDFLIVANDASSAESIKESISKVSSEAGRPTLDVKIYTEDEFKNAKSGKEHLFLWTALSNGQVLCGEDITKGIELNKRRVVNRVWEELQTITDSFDKLEMNAQFTGCCFSLYQAFKTIYFVERFILEKPGCPPKRVFMEQMLEKAYSLVRERYYYVTRQVKEPEFSQDIKLPLSVDRKFDPSDYRIVRKQCKMVVDYLQNTYSKVTEWAEV